MAFFRRRPLRLRTKHARRSLLLHFVYGGVAIAFVALVLYGVGSITRLPYFTIDAVEVEGGPTVSEEAVRMIVEQELEGSYLLLVPKRFTYAYPHKKILERLGEIPRIAHAEVTRTDKNTLHIAFDEYAPYALWCDADVIAESEEGQKCVFLSETGYAFAKAPSLQGTAFIRYVTDDRAPTEDIQIFDEERLRGMEIFMEGLKSEFGLRVYQVTLTRDEDIIYHLKGESRILVTGAMEVQEAFDNLHSVLGSEEFKGLTPGAFDYIDLRFGNRVFVKEEFTSAAKEVATSTELLQEAE